MRTYQNENSQTLTGSRGVTVVAVQVHLGGGDDKLAVKRKKNIYTPGRLFVVGLINYYTYVYYILSYVHMRSLLTTLGARVRRVLFKNK